MNRWDWMVLATIIAIVGTLWLLPWERDFEPIAWRENSTSFLGEDRFRMRHDLQAQIRLGTSREELLALLGAPLYQWGPYADHDREVVKYRLGQGREWFGLMANTYWLTVEITEGKVTHVLMHAD